MNKLVKYIIESRFNFNIDLLDFEDNEGEFSLSRQLYKPKSMKQEYIENSLFVDLGLPSGTLWCKYNLGCDFALLSTKPETTFPNDWYGKYYAWGEVEEKDCYDWEIYKFEKNVSDSGYNFIKYCTKLDYGRNGFIDGLTELLPEDDAAYQYNSSWRIPTRELFGELLKHTDNRWISGEEDDLYMNVKGLKGRLFTSKINGNQLFVPAAGYMEESSLGDVGSYCFLWSSNLNINYPNHAWNLRFFSIGISMGSFHRCLGLSIRPVLK